MFIIVTSSSSHANTNLDHMTNALNRLQTSSCNIWTALQNAPQLAHHAVNKEWFQSQRQSTCKKKPSNYSGANNDKVWPTFKMDSGIGLVSPDRSRIDDSAITNHTAESPFVKINQIHEAVQQCDNAAESPHPNSLFALLLLRHVSVVLGIFPKGWVSLFGAKQCQSAILHFLFD